MPAIQDAYSIHVSNRFALSINDKEGYESDTYVDVDPLEQLRLIEEQQKQSRESKKKGKQVDPEKPVSKKEVQFKENKNANVQSKKHSDSKKDDRNQKGKSKKDSSKDSDKPVSNRDRQPAPGEENRRPRRQNNQRWEKQPPRERGEGDQFGGTGRSYDDPPERSYRKGNGNPDGEGRLDRGGNRYERYRGSRGGGFRGGSRGGSFTHRGNFRSDGRDDRGKREFDRRSGSDKSGVRPVDKRDGAGPRNWGTPGNEIEEVLEPSFENEDNGNWADQGENEANQKSGNSDNENKKDEAEEVSPEEVGPTEMTLDEYKKMQNSNSKKKQFNIRRAGEGEDRSKWKGMKVIHESVAAKQVREAHHVAHEEAQKKGSNKQNIEMDIRFETAPRSGRGGRGGRGFRGGGGRGGFRGGQRGGGGRYGNRYNHQAPPPDVLNEKEFPTLPAA